MTATLPTAGTLGAPGGPGVPGGAPGAGPTPPAGSTHRGRGRRLLAGVARLVGVTVPVFLLATMVTFGLGAVSGLSPAGQMLGDSATPADVARVNAELGLDRPWVVRYVDWLGGVLHGDLGTSWLNGVPVSEQIGQRIDVSFSVAGFALVIGVVAGTALGLLAAVHHGRWPDRAVTGFTTLISTLPPFVVGIGLIVVLCVALPVFPSSGYVPFAEDPAAWIALITLPAIALSLDAVADIARQLRTGVVAAQRENYVTGALVRGLSPRRVLWVHVLRNGAGPALAVLGLRVPMLIGNAVVTESVFGLPGFGRFAADGAVRGDVPVVQGTLVVAIVVVLVFNLLVNVVLVRLRPAAGRGT